MVQLKILGACGHCLEIYFVLYCEKERNQENVTLEGEHMCHFHPSVI